MSYARLFQGLDRAAPGDAESLIWAVNLAAVAEGAAILDAGCGFGADLSLLATLRPKGRIVAVDLMDAFVARAQAAHPGATVVRADMTDPPGGPFDFIWSAGAVYGPGVETCLAAWRGHLRDGGAVAFSDLCWRVAAPSRAAREFWAGEGLQLCTAEDLEARVAEAGYDVIGARWVGQDGWAAYYEPLAQRLAEGASDELAQAFRAEIDVWRAHGGDYGYRLIVARPT